jgi:putative ABC transport system permease protein
MVRHLKFTVRRLLKRPLFALAAVGTLAVGIGAITAIFSTVNATLLRPLPYPDADELYVLSTQYLDGRFTTGRISGSHVMEINEVSQTVRHAATFSQGTGVLMVDGDTPRDVMIARVGDGFFDLFGVQIAAGRSLTSEDMLPVEQEFEVMGTDGEMQTVVGMTLPSIAIMSHTLWTEVFGSDPAVLDGPVRLRGLDVTVVGVAPPDFDQPLGTDLWMGTTTGYSSTVTIEGGYLRTHPGVTREALESELRALSVGLEDRFPVLTGRTMAVTPLNESIVGDLGPLLLIVLAGAVVLLVLACVNVATLLLARAAGQTKELAVRAALGARRRQIIGHFMTESFVLAVAGTLAGLLLAFVGVQLLLGLGGDQLPRLDSVPFDGRVLAFAVGVLFLATVLVGVLPALRLRNPDLRGLLNESSRSTIGGRGTRRVLGGLIVAEIALAIVLVAGAGWLVSSYVNLSNDDLGFETAGRLLVDPLLPESQAALQNLLSEGPERLLGLGQVRAVATGHLPLSRFTAAGSYVAVPGQPFDPARPDVAYTFPVSEDFIDATGTRLLAGRWLTAEDRPPMLTQRINPTTGEPEIGTLDPLTGEFTPGPPGPSEMPRVVVNEEFAARYFPDRDPIGATFAAGAPTVNLENLREVVGVVETIKYRGLQGEPVPGWYTLTNLGPRNWIVSTSADDPTSLIPTIRSALTEVEPSAQFAIEPFDRMVSDALWRHRLGLVLMVLFAGISLALAAIGIFGVIADATALRTRELATRMALGATPGNVVSVLLNEAWARALLGVIIGLGAAYAAGRITASRLYGVSSSDPRVLSAAVIAVLTVTLVAFLLPALRAARISPAEALKDE